MNQTLVIAGLVLGLAGFASAQHQYLMTDLGTLGGSQSDPEAINAVGQVCGNSYLPGDTTLQAFRTQPNAAINPATDGLGTLGGQRSNCRGLNQAGQAVGSATIPGDPTDSFGFFIARGFRTAPNAVINPLTDDLGGLGRLVGNAVAINAGGQAAGHFLFLGDRAFRTAPNSPINPFTDYLGSLQPGVSGDFSRATGMNALGQVVGNSRKAISGTAIERGFRTAPNSPINPATDDLGSLGGIFTIASAINDSGQVVGGSNLAGDTVFHAFRTGPNLPINPFTDDLGTLFGGQFSSATGINSQGDVVGSADNSEGTTHGFLYRGGVMHDLNDLVPPGSGWELTRAFAINDNGQIAARGVLIGDPDQTEHAFRLDPAPALLLSNLINQISDPSFGLTDGGRQSLTILLTQALKLVEKSASKAIVKAFQGRVEILARNGQLSSEKSSSLIAAANLYLATD